jgi:hypothetical protein
MTAPRDRFTGHGPGFQLNWSANHVAALVQSGAICSPLKLIDPTEIIAVEIIKSRP